MKNLKYYLFTLLMVLSTIGIYACDACQKQQPKILKGISHGAGPESKWDWFIIVAIFATTLITLVLTIKYIAKPGEKSQEHIKRIILN